MTVDPLQTLLINHACTRAIITFATLNDAGEYEKLSKLFSEDGKFARPSEPDNFITGRSAIQALLEARAPRKTRHLVGNIEVIVTGPDTARASSSISLYAAPLGSDVVVSPILIGRYDDELIRQGDHWLFSCRKGSVDFRIESPAR